RQRARRGVVDAQLVAGAGRVEPDGLQLARDRAVGTREEPAAAVLRLRSGRDAERARSPAGDRGRGRARRLLDADPGPALRARAGMRSPLSFNSATREPRRAFALSPARRRLLPLERSKARA